MSPQMLCGEISHSNHHSTEWHSSEWRFERRSCNLALVKQMLNNVQKYLLIYREDHNCCCTCCIPCMYAIAHAQQSVIEINISKNRTLF